MSKARVLVVDGEQDIPELLRITLPPTDVRCTAAPSLGIARRMPATKPFRPALERSVISAEIEQISELPAKI